MTVDAQSEIGPGLRLRRVLSGHARCLSGLAWSPDGALASASFDRTVKLWDVERDAPRRTLAGHAQGVRAVAWSADGKKIATASDDRTVRLWDAAGSPVAVLQGHTAGVNAVGFVREFVASASDDQTVRLWDAATGEPRATLTGHRNWVRALATDGRALASASDDLTVRQWDPAGAALVRVLEGHRNWVRALATDGRLLASAGFDQTIRIWETSTGRPVRTIEGHRGRLRSLAFSPDGRLLASGAEDDTLRLWRSDTWECAGELRGSGAAFHPREPLIAVHGERDLEIQVVEFEGFDFEPAREGGPATRTSLRDWAGATHTTLAIVFTDIVGSTALGNRIGEERMGALRREHFAAARRLIEARRGKEIKTIGDAFMIAFRTAVDALDFALEFQAATRDRPLRVRVGIHVGPASIEDEDAFGPMVNFASRVQGMAKGPEIWVSERAKGDVDAERATRHAPLPWREHRDCELKGFPGPHRLWSLSEPS